MKKDPILCEDNTLKYCEKVIHLYRKSVIIYKTSFNEDTKSCEFNFLLNKVMTLSNGCCNPDLARETLYNLLNKKQRKYKDRWSEGIPHDPRSIKIYKGIEKIAYEEYGDYFCFKSGGDGDNGEILMYILDDYFEDEDNKGCILCEL